MRLKQLSTVATPLVRQFVLLALIASGAGNYNVFWPVRSTAINGDYMIDVVTVANGLLTPVTLALLSLILTLNIFRVMSALRKPYFCTAVTGSSKTLNRVFLIPSSSRLPYLFLVVLRPLAVIFCVPFFVAQMTDLALILVADFAKSCNAIGARWAFNQVAEWLLCTANSTYLARFNSRIFGVDCSTSTGFTSRYETVSTPVCFVGIFSRGRFYSLALCALLHSRRDRRFYSVITAFAAWIKSIFGAFITPKLAHWQRLLTSKTDFEVIHCEDSLASLANKTGVGKAAKQALSAGHDSRLSQHPSLIIPQGAAI